MTARNQLADRIALRRKADGKRGAGQEAGEGPDEEARRTAAFIARTQPFLAVLREVQALDGPFGSRLSVEVGGLRIEAVFEGHKSPPAVPPRRLEIIARPKTPDQVGAILSGGEEPPERLVENLMDAETEALKDMIIDWLAGEMAEDPALVLVKDAEEAPAEAPPRPETRPRVVATRPRIRSLR